MLTRPKRLLPSGRVAVLAASSPSELPRIQEAVARLEAYGLKVTLAPNIATYGERPYLAGTDEDRAEQFNRFLNSDEYDGFLFARGGYGAMRILDRIDYAAIRRNPRPIIGFSDVTALNQAIALHAGVASFHGPMVNLDFFNGLSPEIERWFWAMLGGEAPLVHRFDSSQVVTAGEAEGILFGGCLSLTTSLTGTPYDFWVPDGIWFWEDVDEPLYRIDRMLTQLKLSGRYAKIRGVVIGKLKGCGDDVLLVDLLRQTFGSAIPVVRGISFGHHGDNLLMPVGAPVRLNTADGTLTLMRAAVER
jgi:muramoyltetrapeptide carboxypeptidase